MNCRDGTLQDITSAVKEASAKFAQDVKKEIAVDGVPTMGTEAFKEAPAAIAGACVHIADARVVSQELKGCEKQMEVAQRKVELVVEVKAATTVEQSPETATKIKSKLDSAEGLDILREEDVEHIKAYLKYRLAGIMKAEKIDEASGLSILQELIEKKRPASMMVATSK